MTVVEAIERIKKGDHRYCGILVSQYKMSVFSIIRNIINDRGLAEEVCQDVFVKSFLKIHQLTEPEKYRYWICKIAYHSAVSAAIKNKKRINRMSDPIDYELLNYAEPCANDEIHQKEIIKKLLNQLKMEEKLVLQFFYFEEFTVQEISKLMKISVSNVKTKLHRSRKKFESIYKQSKSRLLTF